MNANDLRQALVGRNLTHLSALSGISVRQLRRIRNGHTVAVLSTTIDTLSKHLKARRK